MGKPRLQFREKTDYHTVRTSAKPKILDYQLTTLRYC